ncbi:MAG: TIGR04282 family arsenosugar biosynthesis glycosyltransferase [Chromatiales bacterium]
MNERRIIVFAKAPEPGEVKTRLIPLLGAAGAAALHKRLVEHTLSTAVSAACGTVEVHGAPGVQHPFFHRCARRHGVVLRAQCDGDLGARMFHALSTAEDSGHSAVVIGSDCAALSVSHLREAFNALGAGKDAVLGPARDGGYYLIGMRRCERSLFDDVAWSTESVLETTRERLRELRWQWHELDQLWDVDRPEDYQLLRRQALAS